MRDSRPKRLERALAYHAEDEGPEAEAHTTEDDFRAALSAAHSSDPLVALWRRHLTTWDYAENPAWSEAPARSDERRTDTYRLLALTPDTTKLLSGLVPVAKTDAPVVISDEFTPWYAPQSQVGRGWYWPAYRRLLSDKGWPDHAVAGLDAASDRVVERLADPTQEAVYQSKGLVVGYVQSGKTANFTGVIAKAVDAGYRLVIVLGGTLNLLRAQTQRRLDMELAGRENILRGAAEHESDYADDPAWAKGKFLSHGGLPSALGGFDIVRMTTRDNDYKSLLQGIVALEFEKQEPALPLYDPRNLHRSSARLMVVKKNKTVLGKLVKDLGKIKTPLSEIPVLIIDDESDEASVNTGKPDADRTAINEKISELLNILPRAQYVGYTATPFANVFVDPSDTEDIFPKDFIVSLPRPDGYMGVRDFHDLDSTIPPEERTYANSNEKAHVRDIVLTSDEDDTALQRAMDMFVLTAAMKLYREDKGGLGDRFFSHHTMLIHESVRTAEHRELLGQVTQLWWDAGYTGSRGHDRLRELFESDLLPVSHVRADGYAVPETYEELAPYIGAAAIRIGGDDQPIIVVNGDKDIETGEADFDKRSIWKILIGGQKLARGFTVEGLTVTYYRRRTNNASTLMQMGRWFGFRGGYRDLVRLYLGREETMGKKDVDLYEAFEAICRDEETFREELKQYAAAEPIDGHPQVTPAQVPPLVSQHLSWLKPTSANKMFNSRLVEIRSPGRWEEPTAYPKKATDLRHNTETWLPVLDRLDDAGTFAYHFEKNGLAHKFEALYGVLSPAELLEVVERLRWLPGEHFAPHLTYLREMSKDPAQLRDWLLVAPQHTRSGKRVTLGDRSREYSWFGVERRRDPLFGGISNPRHRAALLRVAGTLASCGDPTTESVAVERRGVVALYPIVEAANTQAIMPGSVIDSSKVVMAFSFVAPTSARGDDERVVRFTTVDNSHVGDAIVDVE
ncbi:Z1 domain-containing protein [Streptomyces sp. WG-D5]